MLYYLKFESKVRLISFCYFKRFRSSLPEVFCKKGAFNPIQDESFWGCSQMRGGEQNAPLPKISQTDHTVMKLGTAIPYLKKIQEKYKSRDTSLELCLHQHFFNGNKQFLLYQEILILILIYNFYFLSFFESLKVVLINAAANLIMAAKLATLGRYFGKGYDVIISIHGVINRILSCDLNYIVDVAM